MNFREIEELQEANKRRRQQLLDDIAATIKESKRNIRRMWWSIWIISASLIVQIVLFVLRIID